MPARQRPPKVFCTVQDSSIRLAPYTKVVLSPVHVALGGTTDIGTMTVQVGGRITGHLPSLYDLYLNATIEAVDGSGRVLASTTGQAGQDYALWGVRAGTTYVRFSGPGLVTTWWRTDGSAAPSSVMGSSWRASIHRPAESRCRTSWCGSCWSTSASPHFRSSC